MKRATPLVIPFVLLVSAAARAQTVDRYQPVEITLTSSKTYSNPYTDATITAQVTPPAGSGEASYSIPGFWDGGSTWRVRWAPRKQGTYGVTVTCSDTSNTGLHNKTFTYSVGPNFSATWAPRGFVRISPSTPYHFAYDDGTPFPWIGDTNWINLYELAWGRTSSRPVTDSLWQALCDRRAEYGFTVLQCVLWNDSERWLDGQYPFGGSNGTNHDVINPISWQRVDARVQYAVKKGLALYLLISSNGQHFAWPQVQRERLQRYIAARYAAYNVWFGGGEEVERGGWGSDDKYRHMISTYHSLDPYRRLVGLHASGFDQILVPSDVDIVTPQYYSGPSKVTFDLMKARARQFGKPFVNAETHYFKCGQPGMDDPVSIRAMTWRIFLAGAAGYTFGQAYVAYRGEGFTTSDLTDSGTQEMQRFAAWWRQSGLRWWEFTRFQNLGSNRYLAAKPGSQYVIMTEDSGAAFTVDLSDASGSLTGRWYNISNGAYGSTVTVSAGSSVTITPPGAWHVLRLDAGSSNQPPTCSITSPATGTSYTAPATVTINASASDPDGSITKVEFFQGSTKLGEDSSSPYSFTWSGVPGGSYTLTAKATDNSGAATTSSPVYIGVQGPYGGSPRAIPGTIQAEDFDEGGQGVAYHDSTSGNSGGSYRTSDVDIEPTSDSGGGFNLGWIVTGEWLEYTVQIASAGLYTLDARVASTGSSGSVRFDLDGADISGTMAVPNTGGWQSWTTVTKTGVSLPAGTHILRMTALGGDFNINWIRLTSLPSVPAAPSNLTATAVSSSQINLAWTDNSSNETGFKIERKAGSGGTWSQIATVGAGVTSYQNTGLSASTTYYYRVRATNSAGDSAYSNEANATTQAPPVTIPAAPSGLTATPVSSSQINLSWTDNSSNETGFKIERPARAARGPRSPPWEPE